jgi:hypothetical protein
LPKPPEQFVAQRAVLRSVTPFLSGAAGRAKKTGLEDMCGVHDTPVRLPTHVVQSEDAHVIIVEAPDDVRAPDLT